ncbi:prefoldin subunit 5-like [Saccostrea echinata]|uniref:prefoldin subunit 5-like n=1 Tax=Saccostrea echinata TaxID=191078 RepID=UPI002A81DB58|nr:prefoldin subunit 5-like [Saccostrea echinata]
MASKQAGQIDIGQLPIPQLNQLVQQLEQEIELFTSSLNQLKLAQQKFLESQECLNKVNPENNSKDILVPLTSSMYVPGQLSDVSNVLVDIGTGYYVEMAVTKGKEYFKRKIDYVTKQMEKVQPLLAEKYKMKQVTMEILQLKIQNQIQSQQAAGAVKS